MQWPSEQSLAIRRLNIRDRSDAKAVLTGIGADPAGVESMVAKMTHLNIRIPAVEPREANIIKQDMLSLGGDAAVGRGTVACSIPRTDVILMGTEKQLRRAVDKFRNQPFRLNETAARLETLLDRTNDSTHFYLKCRKGVLNLSERTHIMGILNVTPDSFSDGGSFLDPERAVDWACRMVEEGADIIDIGGESTRPGATSVPLEDEIGRVVPVIERLAAKSRVPLSIDTCKAEVAKRAIDAGADIINDISGLRFDNKMAAIAAGAGCPLILMHIKGTPQDMQVSPHYESLIDEIIDYLEEGIAMAIEAGIERDNIVVDPGIGFGKRLEDNLSIINNLNELGVLGRPVLAGVSRKSFIGKILDADVEERLEGTLAASVLAIEKGAHILRTHDVKEAVRAAKMADAILKTRDIPTC